ncbi:uncharacterized protein DSM5745_10129 [Aspergillus mulundensis]|uniref:DUF7719 domain-containing protein n=1 Tax=Aspergillus mulundensis TaxID=1810919 RepID=A0A3D8QMU4_9EURO|nr:Uncharacterized protein DSM5745_10129 [Aspergillus mulundensis]RDW63018.1 Uncharacterized protein DSM5745_10129 [Aspergillus mulundensis]
MDPPRNRKQRRAAASASRTDSFDPSSIPLARPQTDSSKGQKDGRTLVDLIAEKQGEIEGKIGSQGSKKEVETKYVTIDPNTGEISPFDEASHASAGNRNESQSLEDADEEAEPIPPLVDTLLLSFPLTVLHLTLGYLAAHQYAQSIDLKALFRNSGFVAFPMLTLLIHLAHGHIVRFHRGQAEPESISLLPWHPEKLSFSFLRKMLFPPSLKTIVFLPSAVILGSKLMSMTNEESYYAVMKQAPAIGTLWVWCILEISVGAAVLGALVPLVWGIWWKGYGII